MSAMLQGTVQGNTILISEEIRKYEGKGVTVLINNDPVDVETVKYALLHNLYEACRDIEFFETPELINTAQTKEEKDFFSIVTDYILQQKQKRVIEENRF